MLKTIKNISIAYFFFWIIFGCNILLASEETIKSISVEGTQRIDKETVVSYSNIKVGDTYTEELGNNILKELFDTNLFSNITISFNNNDPDLFNKCSIKF